MIYLDNAATTYKKPIDTYLPLLRRYANAGRGGHAPALKTAHIIEETRYNLAEFFHAPSATSIAFANNATHALNLAIHGILRNSTDHCILTPLEHNSVIRPLIATGCLFDIAQPHEIEQNIKETTKLIIVTHASNVTGEIQDVAQIAQMAHAHKIPLLIDAAQTAGALPINLAQNPGISLLAFPAHKHLFGIQGSGGLYVAPHLNLRPLLQGGTGTNSLNISQDNIPFPASLEPGTLAAPGIAALGAGIKFIDRIGIGEIREHEQKLTTRLLQCLLSMPNIIVYGPESAAARTGTISINIKDKNGDIKDPIEIANALWQRHKIATRAGFHCAPLAHNSLGTTQFGGTLRISLSYFTRNMDIERVVNALNNS